MNALGRCVLKPRSPLSPVRVWKARSLQLKSTPLCLTQKQTYYVHPEQLMHLYKAKHAHRLCNYIDSDNYQKFLASLVNGSEQYVEEINSDVTKQMKKYSHKNDKIERRYANEPEEKVVKTRKKMVKTKVLPLMLKKKSKVKTHAPTVHVEWTQPSIKEDKMSVSDGVKKSTILPIVLEKKKRSIEAEVYKQMNKSKELPYYIKRIQKIQKLQQVHRNLKLLESMKPSNKNKEELFDIYSLTRLNTSGEAFQATKRPNVNPIWDNVTIKKPQKEEKTLKGYEDINDDLISIESGTEVSKEETLDNQEHQKTKNDILFLPNQIVTNKPKKFKNKRISSLYDHIKIVSSNNNNNKEMKASPEVTEKSKTDESKKAEAKNADPGKKKKKIELTEKNEMEIKSKRKKFVSYPLFRKSARYTVR